LIVFKVLALAAFIFIPGWLAVSLLGRTVGGLKKEERFYLAWVAGAGLVAFCVELMALASSYSLVRLLLLVSSVALVLALLARRKVLWLKDLGAMRWLLILTLVAAALVLFVPPGRNMLIGNDVGGYANIAAKIDREGTLHSEYETVREVSPERRDLLFWPNFDPSIQYAYKALEAPGFFITDFGRGEVVPMFYYLWPSLMAAFAAFLGLGNMFWAITFVSILALAGIFLLARRMLGNRWGFAALILVALFPLMVYFSRYATSEIFTMTLFIAGSLCLISFLRLEEGEDEGKDGNNPVRLAVAAALFFTLGFFCRIDFSLVAIPLAAFFFFKRILKGTSKADLWFLGMTLGGAGISLLVGAFFSRPYFYYTWSVTIPSWFWLFRFPGISLLLFVLIALALGFVFGPRMRKGLRKLVSFKRVGYALIWVALAAIFVYIYYIRSMKIYPPDTLFGVDPHGFSNINQGLVRWAWFFSFVGVVFIYLGYALWFTRARRYSQVPVVLVGLAFTLMYSWKLNDVPLYFLSMRRLLPVILPLALIMIIYVLKSMEDGTDWLFRKHTWGHWAGKLLAGGFLLYFIFFSVNVSAPVFGLREGGNQMQVCSDIAGQVENGGLVLVDATSGMRFGEPLHCFYGLEEGWIIDNSTLGSEQFKPLLADLGFSSTPIYLLWWPSKSGEQVPLVGGLQLKDVAHFSWQEEDMQTTAFYRPAKRVYPSETLILYRIEPG
jgi:Dolichyl-phosphate-mannose-protein mannosyltransferase